MVFDFDPAKSAANRLKHGIDFEQAKAIWTDDGRIVTEARSDTEPRFAVVGVIDGKHWTAFFTFRVEVVRIISVRRSRANEVNGYAAQNDQC